MTAVVRDIEQRIQQAGTPAQRLAALVDLAHAHAAALRNREGLRAARQALELARARGDNLSACRALAAATLCHYQRCDYVAAVATGLDAIAAFAAGDLRGRSGARQSVALALHCVGAPDLARATALEAIADAQACHDERCEAAAREVLGMIRAAAGEQNGARREYRQAAATFGRRGDEARVKKLTARIGHTYRDQGIAADAAGHAPQARFYWRQALRVYRIALAVCHGDALDALILQSVGECELRLGDAGAAAAAIGMALATGLDCPAVMGPCHLWDSHVLRANGELRAAEQACERARRAAERLEQGPLLAECLHAQAQIADQLGRFETGNDLERRAREVAADRAALLAGVREQLARFHDAFTGGEGPGASRAA